MPQPRLTNAMVRRRSGQFKGSPQLTDKQNLFVSLYLANGGDHVGAAEAAGYVQPSTEGWRLIRNEKVGAVIHKARIAEIRTNASGMALTTLEDLMMDETVPATARIKCATVLLEIGGYLGRGKDDEDTDNRPFSEYSMAELQAIISEGLERRDEEARTIVVERVDDPGETDPSPDPQE